MEGALECVQSSTHQLKCAEASGLYRCSIAVRPDMIRPDEQPDAERNRGTNDYERLLCVFANRPLGLVCFHIVIIAAGDRLGPTVAAPRAILTLRYASREIHPEDAGGAPGLAGDCVGAQSAGGHERTLPACAARSGRGRDAA